MNEWITGMIHIHSHFSKDGFCSVADLADFARQAGLQFLGLTEHAEDLSSADVESLRGQCKKHSDESFVMIPGLEFRCTANIHILGLGITDHISNSDPVAVAAHVQAAGGLAVLAHPVRSNYQCPPKLWRHLNGIEVWNAGYDGRFVPPLANLRLLQRARGDNPAIFGLGGVDLHRLQVPEVVLRLPLRRWTRIEARVLLDYLQRGRFTVRGRYVSFDAHAGRLPLAWLPLWVFRKAYEVSKTIRDVALGSTWAGP